MNTVEKQLHTAAQKVQLSAQEKYDIRSRVIAHVQGTRTVKVSPYTTWMTFIHQSRFQYTALFIVTLIVCGSVSTVADYSLPGEPLYQVKSVNENIRGLFATTPQSRAQLHVELAVRRLEEAEQLAAAGKLQNELKQEVEARLDQHLAVIKDNLIVLEQQNASSTPVLDKEATIENTEATTTIAQELEQVEPAQEQIDPITLLTSEIQATTTLATTTKETEGIEAVEVIIEATTTPVTVETKLKEASNTLKEGASKVTAAQYTEAYALVEKVEQKTKEIKSILNEGDTKTEPVQLELTASATTTEVTTTITSSSTEEIATTTTATTSSLGE